MDILLPGKIHASCILLPDCRAGVLIAGPSGAGKSDLALRMVDEGAQLVSDDYTQLDEHGGRLVATAPGEIAGMIEIRGLGVVRLDDAQVAPSANVVLFAELVPEELRSNIARMPDPAFERIGSHDIRKIVLCAFDASAPARLRAAARLGLDQTRLIE